ncbi:HNH endonuclease [Microbacterium maritypicum]
MGDIGMKNERWRTVPEYEGLYEVSDLGRVRNSRTGHVRSVNTKPSGHQRVLLWRDGKEQGMYVHRLVLMAFVGPCPEGMEGCHNDGDPANNGLDNLRWDTRAGNTADSLTHGTHHQANKTHCPRGHLLQAPNLTKAELRLGRRGCLACRCGSKTYRRHGGDLQELADRHYARIMKSVCPKCVGSTPGQPPHTPSPACTRRPIILPHCACTQCFG